MLKQSRKRVLSCVWGAQGERERHREAEKERETKITVNNCSAKRFVSFCHFASFRSKSKSLRFAMKPQSLKLSFQFDILVEIHSALLASRGFYTICSITTHFAEPYLLPITFAIVWLLQTRRQKSRIVAKNMISWRDAFLLPIENMNQKFKYQQNFLGERGEIATRTTLLLTVPLFFTFLTSNFPTLFVLLSLILWSGSFSKIPSGKRKIS